MAIIHNVFMSKYLYANAALRSYAMNYLIKRPSDNNI